MIPSLSEKISSFFAAHGVIGSEDKDVYSYSFEILLATLLNLLVVIIIAIITKTVVETFFYLFAFIPLRQFAGGYHAKNHIRCFLLLLMVYTGFLAIIRLMPAQHTAITILLCVITSSLVIFILSPMDDTNKPFTEKQRNRLKQRSRIAITIYTVLVMMIFVLNEVWALSLSLGLMSIAFSLLASVVKRKVSGHTLPYGNQL